MSTPLRVRRATVADAPALTRLITELGHRSRPADLVARMRALPEGHAVLVAERGAGVVGFVHVAVDPSLIALSRAQVVAVAVAGDHRGAGIGGRLVDEAAAWAREHGCHHLWVRSSVHEEDAHGFYRAAAFEQVPDQLEFRRAIEGAVDPIGGPDGAVVVPVVVRTTPTV